jgi:hypothetical protein
VRQLNRLQNMRFVHSLDMNESLPDSESSRYNGYLLDASQLAAQRAWQVDFMSWQKREKRRARKLAFRPVGEERPWSTSSSSLTTVRRSSVRSILPSRLRGDRRDALSSRWPTSGGPSVGSRQGHAGRVGPWNDEGPGAGDTG